MNKRYALSFFSLLIFVAAIIYYFVFAADVNMLDNEVLYVTCVIILVVLVHILKALRLYIILYGTLDISLADYLKLYTMTTPVSAILPFKMGEIYRLFVYGNYMSDYIKGTIIVLLDRFIDTAALIFIVLISFLIYGGQISSIVFFFILFLFLVILFYLSFKSIYLYWNKRMIKAPASKKSIGFLKYLKNVNAIYDDVSLIYKGKGIILLLLSILAWILELSGLVLTSKKEGFGNLLIDYLQSIMGQGSIEYNKEFVFFSVIILTTIFIIINVFYSIKRIKGFEKDN